MTDVKMQWGIKIPLRTGVQLSATLYLPRYQTKPAPVLLTLTPYVGQTYHERGVYFATHGYPFLTVDVRGRGNSQGEFHPLAESQDDGYDVVEWLARQDYCNGRVAMWGGSYQGYIQWATARKFPPHLATMVPVASPYRGLDSPMRNNIGIPNRIQWLTYLSGRTAQDKIFADRRFWSDQFKRWFESGTAFRALDSFVGNSNEVFQEWVCHPQLDAYWDSYNPSVEQYAKISIPILTITGAYDANQPGSLMHHREHLKYCPAEVRARHYLVIGPWDHAGTRTPTGEFAGIKVAPASVVDLPKLHLQWYAWTMQGGPKPEFLKKNVAYYVIGAERWRYADTLEDVTARTEPLYLHSTTNPTDVFNSGSLSTEPDDGGPDRYVYDPCDVSLAELESAIDPSNMTDQRKVHAAAGKQLVYHSAPFEQVVEISGFFKLSVWLSIDRPDTDFAVSIHQIAIDGSAIQLSADVLRARYRESLREAKLIGTEDPLRYDFERFMFVSRRMEKGSRLRLVIGPIDSIFYEKNFNSGGTVADESMRDAHTVTVKLFHDKSYPSALYVPYGRF